MIGARLGALTTILAMTACKGAAPPTRSLTVADPEQAPVVQVAAGPGQAALTRLEARLQREALHGFVMVDGGATLYPSADSAIAEARDASARKAPGVSRAGYVIVRDGLRERPGGVSALRVLEDQGEVVKVATWLGKRVPLPVVDASYQLEAFVRREALSPVLREGKLASFDDGSAVVLRAGLVLSPGSDDVRPSLAVLARLPVELSHDEVGLSFVLPDQELELPAVKGEEMACQRVVHGGLMDSREETRVLGAEALRREEEEKLQRERGHDDSFGRLGYGSFHGIRGPTCTLRSRYEEVKDAPSPLRVNGTDIAQPEEIPGDACFDSVRVQRGARGLLVRIELPRASVRALVDEHALREVGGCGAAGGMGRSRPMVWAAKGDVVAYYPNGQKAGRHVGGVTKLRATQSVGERVCFSLPYLAVQLCHERADLIEVEDSRW